MRLPLLSILPLVLATTFIGACKKERETSVVPIQTTTDTNPLYVPTNFDLSSLSRYAGEQYSQSISITSANAMISSYLSSIHFPAMDTAIRSLAFDADTLRSYLADTSIKTIRFYMAHTPAQVQLKPGAYAGYNPQALTMIIVGYSQNDSLIKNKHNGVYEHFYPCPANCIQTTNGLLQ